MRTNCAAGLAVAVVLTGIASSARAATIGVLGNVSWQPTPGGGHATRMNGTDLVVDNSLNPIVRIDVAMTSSQGDHQGVHDVYYDLYSPQAEANNYVFNHVNPEGRAGMYRADSGFNNIGVPAVQDVSAPAYSSPAPCFEFTPNYQGGWGLNSGLPHWGQTYYPGRVGTAGDSQSDPWSGDLDSFTPGIQSFGRIGIGIGANVAPADDPNLGGQTLGFGADVANGIGGGGGEWWFQSLLLDTTGWDRQTYTFDFTPLVGSVLRSGVDLSLPYEFAHSIRQIITNENLFGGSIQFTLVPEPALTLVLVSGLALIRRRNF